MKKGVSFESMSMLDLALFWAKVRITNRHDCWVWQAAKIRGYGTFRGVAAHRLAWEIINQRSLGEMHACHHCDNPSCVNPDHIFPGTHDDNMADMVAKNALRKRDESPDFEP